MAGKDGKKPSLLKVTERDRKLIVVVGTAAIVVACLWFFLYPMWNTHNQLELEAQELATQIQEAADSADIQELAEQAQSDEEASSQLLKGFSYTLDSAQADKLTANMAKRYGFTIYNLVIDGLEDVATLGAFGSEEDSELRLAGIGCVDLSLTLDGSRSKIQNFINKVEEEYPGTHIKSYSWVDNADGSSWNLVCEMTVYTRER